MTTEPQAGAPAFSPSDAALEGFRLTRERPKAFRAWIGFAILLSAVGAILTLVLPAEVRDALDAISNEENVEPEMLVSWLAATAPILLFGLAAQRAFDAAIYRTMFGGQNDVTGNFRFGADELRLMALRLIFIAMGVFVVFLMEFAVGLVSMMVAGFSPNLALVVATVGVVGSMGVLLWCAVRLSFASVMTFRLKRLAIFDSWAATRGQFWRLFGAYVLAMCCILVMAVLALVLFTSVAGVLLIATGGSLSDLSEIMKPKTATLGTYLNPFVIAYMVVGSVFSALYSAVLPAPAAYAYKKLRPETDAP